MNKRMKNGIRYKSLWLMLGLTALISSGCGAGESGRNQGTEAGAKAEVMEPGAAGEEESRIGTIKIGTDETGDGKAGNGEDGSGEVGADGLGSDEAADSKETGRQSKTSFRFADVEGREFYFSSGSGGWYEVLYIHGDGTFNGHFQDSDMGVTGDGYPNGTLYYSEYTGTFTEPRQLDDTTWTFQIDSIQYANQSGTEEVKDGTCYVYTDSYGLGEAKELKLYLPGADIAGLPEEYRKWVGYYDPEKLEETKLPFYGLYNVNNQTGFSSYTYEQQNAYSQAWDRIKKAEEQEAKLQTKLQNAQTQLEMNRISGDIYGVWDDALNGVWKILKENLDQAVMESLTKDERAWITTKEKAVETAAAGVSGGSMEAMIRNMEAAKLTRDRVYVLVKYLSVN